MNTPSPYSDGLSPRSVWGKKKEKQPERGLFTGEPGDNFGHRFDVPQVTNIVRVGGKLCWDSPRTRKCVRCKKPEFLAVDIPCEAVDKKGSRFCRIGS